MKHSGFPVHQMNPYMPDTKNHYSQCQKHILPIHCKKHKCHNRQRRPCHRNAKQTAVKIFHVLFTFKITYPEYFIENHTKKGYHQPQTPPGPFPDIKIRKNQRQTGNENFSCSFHRQQYSVFTSDILFIIFWFIFCP